MTMETITMDECPLLLPTLLLSLPDLCRHPGTSNVLVQMSLVDLSLSPVY